MIISMKISGVATYPEEGVEINSLRNINYFFGYNGCGKTTISRVINNPILYEKCQITWKNNQILKSFVYNSDFINKNLNQSMDGILTLGEDSIEKNHKIDSISETIKEKEKERQSHIDEKEKIITSREKIDKDFYNAMWSYKTSISSYKNCLNGYRSDKKKFSQKILKEFDSQKVPLINEDDFSKRYATVFSSDGDLYSPLKVDNHIIKYIEIYEKNSILSMRIVGCDDNILSDLIKELDNYDWVQHGMPYLEKTDEICPFCQQKTNLSLKENLKKLFDTSYRDSISEINKIYKEYINITNSFHEEINNVIVKLREMPLIDKHNELIDIESIQKALRYKFTQNLYLFEQKTKRPSEIINKHQMEYTVRNIEKFLLIIDKLNHSIDEHNTLINRKKRRRRKIKKSNMGLYYKK